MANKKSKAPGFGSGNGKLKQPKIGGKLGQRSKIWPFPSVPKRSY